MVSCGLTAAFLIEPGWQLFFVKFAGCTIKISRWWFSNIFYFHPYLGKIPILTNIFQMGWNHQPDLFCVSPIFPLMTGSWLRPGWVRRVISMQIVPQCSKRVGSAQYQGGTKSQCDILVTLYIDVCICYISIIYIYVYIWMCMLLEGHVRIQDFYGLTRFSTTAHLELAKSACLLFCIDMLQLQYEIVLRNLPGNCYLSCREYSWLSLWLKPSYWLWSRTWAIVTRLSGHLMVKKTQAEFSATSFHLAPTGCSVAESSKGALRTQTLISYYYY